MKLQLELVPQSCFTKNVRQLLTKAQWQILSQQIKNQAYDICEICSSHGNLDCHEVWDYDDKNLIQKLIKLEAICKNCHGVKHFGFSETIGKGKQTLNHLMKINKITKVQAEKYINDCFDLWHKRSQKTYQLDVSLLKSFGIKNHKI